MNQNPNGIFQWACQAERENMQKWKRTFSIKEQGFTKYQRYYKPVIIKSILAYTDEEKTIQSHVFVGST